VARLLVVRLLVLQTLLVTVHLATARLERASDAALVGRRDYLLLSPLPLSAGDFPLPVQFIQFFDPLAREHRPLLGGR
jgi:hypothetical protein